MSDLHERLPVKKTVIEATKITYGNLPYLFRISWIAILIFAIASFFLEGQSTPVGTYLGLASLGLVSIGLGSMVAVAWHRFILLGEVTEKSSYLQFDQRTWNYFYFWLITWLLVWGASSIFAVVQYFGSDNLKSFFGVLGLLFLPLLLILARLVMVLPAKALGVKAVTINSAWQMTRQHFGALVAGFILMMLPTLPLIFVAYLFELRPTTEVSVGYRALSVLIRSVCDFIASGLWLTFMSLAFKHIYELPDQSQLNRFSDH